LPCGQDGAHYETEKEQLSPDQLNLLSAPSEIRTREPATNRLAFGEPQNDRPCVAN
jgi:hypothetical protein